MLINLSLIYIKLKQTMKTLRLIMLALMACAVLTCCTEELTNENGNGGNNGGTTTPTQYMWPKYRGGSEYFNDIVIHTRYNIDTIQGFLHFFLRGCSGDTLIKAFDYAGLQDIKAFNWSASINELKIYIYIYIGDTNKPSSFHPALTQLIISGDSAIIHDVYYGILFRGVKCD